MLLSLSHCFLSTLNILVQKFLWYFDFSFSKNLHIELLFQNTTHGIFDEHYIIILLQTDDDVLRYLEWEFQNPAFKRPVVQDQFHVFASNFDHPDTGSRLYQFVETVER